MACFNQKTCQHMKKKYNDNFRISVLTTSKNKSVFVNINYILSQLQKCFKGDPSVLSYTISNDTFLVFKFP